MYDGRAAEGKVDLCLTLKTTHYTLFAALVRHWRNTARSDVGSTLFFTFGLSVHLLHVYLAREKRAGSLGGKHTHGMKKEILGTGATKTDLMGGGELSCQARNNLTRVMEFRYRLLDFKGRLYTFEHETRLKLLVYCNLFTFWVQL